MLKSLDLSGLLPPLTRALAIVKALDPARLTQVIFDFSSVLRSQFWDGRRTGPDFISPMASLTKRQSGHLAKLVHEHSKNLPNLEPCGTDTSRQHDFPQAVAILDLREVPDHPLESQYTTPADTDLMVLVPILLSLLISLRIGQWSLTFKNIAFDFIHALLVGPGTLKLIRRSSAHPTELDPGSGCAILLDDDLTVVIQGSQEVVEAITEGGFYLSLWNSEWRSPAEGQQTLSGRRALELILDDLLCGALEGGYLGGCEFIALRLLHLHFAVPRLYCSAVALGRVVVLVGTICQWAVTTYLDRLPKVAEVTPLGRAFGELLGLTTIMASFAFGSPDTLWLNGVSYLTLCFYVVLFLQSRNYPIRTQQFLNALPLPADRPPIKKWPFRTRASAATFACLVLCRDSPRPVKDIDVCGVLDTLIPNERDIWRAWKKRVSDRIVHETDIHFAPTIPTFPDSERQKRLKLLLDEAQSAYETYSRLPPRRRESAPVSGKALS